MDIDISIKFMLQTKFNIDVNVESFFFSNFITLFLIWAWSSYLYWLITVVCGAWFTSVVDPFSETIIIWYLFLLPRAILPAFHSPCCHVRGRTRKQLGQWQVWELSCPSWPTAKVIDQMPMAIDQCMSESVSELCPMKSLKWHAIIIAFSNQMFMSIIVFKDAKQFLFCYAMTRSKIRTWGHKQRMRSKNNACLAATDILFCQFLLLCGFVHRSGVLTVISSIFSLR